MALLCSRLIALALLTFSRNIHFTEYLFYRTLLYTPMVYLINLEWYLGVLTYLQWSQGLLNFWIWFLTMDWLIDMIWYDYYMSSYNVSKAAAAACSVSTLPETKLAFSRDFNNIFIWGWFSHLLSGFLPSHSRECRPPDMWKVYF